MKLLTYCNKVIEYSFYALFFLVPLVFSGDTSELFELNKMWLTFAITAIIGAAWASKMVLQKKMVIQRTPIDILLLLFLVSQIISSIFSLDQYVSWWGYYSRFNGGLLSTICYIILYYAFVSNMEAKQVFRTILVSLISGLFVSLWGFPSHFGADPTCLVFRGTLDTSCWTDAFKPTIRAFSTLGQPAWLAAYMAFLIPVSMAYTVKNSTNKVTYISYLLLTIFFYLLLLFSDTRAGYIAFWAANILFWAAIFFKKMYPKKQFFKQLLIINIFLILSSFVFGHGLDSFRNYASPLFPKPAPTAAPAQTQTAQTGSNTTAPASTASIPNSINITDSGKIRLLVWKGAINAWENNPLFGTGVETYAFAYYKYKLPAHNLTSEWDYLYNKAHNEYLNYLATTGIFGLGTYLGFIGVFLFMTGKWYINKSSQKDKEAFKEIDKPLATTLLVISMIAGYFTILISNFFGFSVVIINLYVYLVPGFVFILLGMLKSRHPLVLPASAAHEKTTQHVEKIKPFQWTMIVIFVGIACWMIIGLIWFRQADISYALGNNLDKVGDYKQAYPQLLQAVQMEPNEPTYKDELAINLAALGAILYSQNDAAQASQVAQNAVGLSTDVVTNHPNNVVFWKDRVRVFYTLSAGDTKDAGTYLHGAVQAIDIAQNLAPTDAKIAYNQGVLYGQIGELPQAIQMLNNTIKLRPYYLDAYIALGLFYHEAAIDKNGKVINPDMQQKAIDAYNFILQHLDPNNATAKKSLEQWRTGK